MLINTMHYVDSFYLLQRDQCRIDVSSLACHNDKIREDPPEVRSGKKWNAETADLLEHKVIIGCIPTTQAVSKELRGE